MARPWIEFVQSQRLPWQTSELGRLRPGAEYKVLSKDPDNGACSLLVRYPAGFEAAGGALGVDDEIFVLDGELTVGARRYAPYAFAHWPGGYATGAWRTESGATVLEFFSGSPAPAGTRIAHESERLVEHLDALAVPYTGKFHPEFPPGAGRKILFQDPATLDTSWLLGTLPLRWAERSEVHPTVEEMYLLAGEVHGNRGVMQPGAYFWRPGGVPHGPYGTKTGNLYFFRTKGGGLSTTYVEPERPFQWWPPYDPVLPEELQKFRGDAPARLRSF